jgi:glycosyltransferase involved in cell wall biosynthesis
MLKKLPRVAFLLHNIDSGGVERVAINLLKELVKYPISIDLVLFEKKGNFLNETPPEVRIVDLSGASSGRLRKIFPLVKYFRQEKPSVLVSKLVQFNVIAIVAKFLSLIPLHVLLVEHLSFDSLENEIKDDPKEKIGLLNQLRKIFYPKANVVAAVSQGLAQALERDLSMKAGTFKVLYNPVIDENLVTKSQLPVEHPWFESGQPPVFLAAGRLAPQKDFLTLIKAFAIFRQKYTARLVILGEGTERQTLEAEISRLNLEADVSLLGFTNNPYAYMSKASVFILSSRFEALPTVLIEALACGCQVIATDCPYGPNEILVNGKYGKLVNIGNTHELADAMAETINSPIDSQLLKLRAYDFNTKNAVVEYLKAMNLDYLLE